MTQQLEMDLPRKRVALAEDVDAAPKGEATLPKTKRWRLRLLQTEPLVIDSETGLGYSSWFIHQIPPCGGYWDTRVDKTSEHQRLWFAPSDDPVTGGGMWYEERAGGLKFVGSHGELGGALWWRGLYRPHPDGYTWVVPGAKRKRVGLV